MATTILRGVFDDHGAANRAASQLRERGVREVQVRSEPAGPAAQRRVDRGGAASVLAFSVLIGAMLGAALGLAIGFPFLALPSVRNELSTIVLTVLLWAGGGALLGAIGGAVVGGLFGSAFTRRAGRAAAAPAPASAERERVVVLVSVEDERTAEQTRRLLHDLSAYPVEAQTPEASR